MIAKDLLLFWLVQKAKTDPSYLMMTPFVLYTMMLSSTGAHDKVMHTLRKIKLDAAPEACRNDSSGELEYIMFFRFGKI